MRTALHLWLLLTFASLLVIIPNQVSAQVAEDCTVLSEPNPLRPYPGRICGPEAGRTIRQTDRPYCAFRPWAAKNIAFMKNQEDCARWPEWSDQAPCILRLFNGIYEINLSAYELPLVSVTRDGSDLTFFNRAQQHLADYLEGRAYYSGVPEPSPDDIDARYEVWNRMGVLRKLMPIMPRNEGQVLQNARRIGVIEAAGNDLHDYIVSYIQGGQPSPWGRGTPVRLSSFRGRYPPDYSEYGCVALTDAAARNACNLRFMQDLRNWRGTLYGRLWPYVPMFTREDALGYVQINPEPLQWFNDLRPAEVSMSTPVFIPHLPRLNQVSTLLRRMLSSLVQPRTTSEVNCNPGVIAGDACVFDIDTIETLAVNWMGGTTGNSVQLCYGDTIARAQAAGFNPQLAILIWLNESNASNYAISPIDFGIADPSIHYNYDAQITRLFSLPNAYRTDPRWSSCFGATAPINPATGRPMTDMEAFLWIFRSGDCDPANPDALEYWQGFALGTNGDPPKWTLVGSCPFPTSPTQ